MTYKGTNCRKNVNWGNGKSMYSMILSTASDLIYDLTHHEIVTFHRQSFLIKIYLFLLGNFLGVHLVVQNMKERRKIETVCMEQLLMSTIVFCSSSVFFAAKKGIKEKCTACQWNSSQHSEACLLFI